MTTPTLLLLPGLACDAALWRDQLPALARLGPTQVAVPQNRPEATTLEAMAQAVLAEHPGPLLLAGASMGAMVALLASQRAPQRVQGLALLGSTARPDTAELKALRTQAIGLFAQGRAEEVLRANLVFAFHPAHARRCQADYLAMVLRAGSEGLIRQNQAVMARPDLRPTLGQVRCPTLVLGGADDQLTPIACQQELADGIAGAQYHALAECGHMLTWEQPAAVTAHLLRWRGQFD